MNSIENKPNRTTCTQLVPDIEVHKEYQKVVSEYRKSSDWVSFTTNTEKSHT